MANNNQNNKLVRELDELREKIGGLEAQVKGHIAEMEEELKNKMQPKSKQSRMENIKKAAQKSAQEYQQAQEEYQQKGGNKKSVTQANEAKTPVVQLKGLQSKLSEIEKNIKKHIAAMEKELSGNNNPKRINEIRTAAQKSTMEFREVSQLIEAYVPPPPSEEKEEIPPPPPSRKRKAKKPTLEEQEAQFVEEAETHVGKLETSPKTEVEVEARDRLDYNMQQAKIMADNAKKEYEKAKAQLDNPVTAYKEYMADLQKKGHKEPLNWQNFKEAVQGDKEQMKLKAFRTTLEFKVDALAQNYEKLQARYERTQATFAEQIEGKPKAVVPKKRKPETVRKERIPAEQKEEQYRTKVEQKNVQNKMKKENVQRLVDKVGRGPTGTSNDNLEQLHQTALARKAEFLAAQAKVTEHNKGHTRWEIERDKSVKTLIAKQEDTREKWNEAQKKFDEAKSGHQFSVQETDQEKALKKDLVAARKQWLEADEEAKMQEVVIWSSNYKLDDPNNTEIADRIKYRELNEKAKEAKLKVQKLEKALYKDEMVEMDFNIRMHGYDKVFEDTMAKLANINQAIVVQETIIKDNYPDTDHSKDASQARKELKKLQAQAIKEADKIIHIEIERGETAQQNQKDEERRSAIDAVQLTVDNIVRQSNKVLESAKQSHDRITSTKEAEQFKNRYIKPLEIKIATIQKLHKQQIRNLNGEYINPEKIETTQMLIENQVAGLEHQIKSVSIETQDNNIRQTLKQLMGLFHSFISQLKSIAGKSTEKSVDTDIRPLRRVPQDGYPVEKLGELSEGEHAKWQNEQEVNVLTEVVKPLEDRNILRSTDDKRPLAKPLEDKNILRSTDDKRPLVPPKSKKEVHWAREESLEKVKEIPNRDQLKRQSADRNLLFSHKEQPEMKKPKLTSINMEDLKSALKKKR